MSSPVAQISPNVTLFLPSVPSGGIKALSKAVTELLRDLGLPVQSSEDISADSMRFATTGPDILVSLSDAPMTAQQTDSCERPEYGQALDQYALRKLESHRAVIGITVEDSRGKVDARTRQSLALTLRLARGLIGETGADLVLWEQTQVLYTVGEFSGLGQPSKQRRPLIAPRSPSASAPLRLDLSGADAALSAAVATPAGAAPKSRSGETAPAQREELRRRVEDLAAPLHAEALRRQEGALADAQAKPEAAAADLPSTGDLPQVEAVRPKPPPARLTLALRWISAQFDHWLDAELYPTRKMQVAVYLMTGLATAIFAPVGLALLAYNLLRRESLKVTAPVLLLTAAAQASGVLPRSIELLRGLMG